MEAVIAYLLATPEIIGAAIVWAVGAVFHLITGTPLTVADAAGCVFEGEFVKAGHYLVDEFGSAVKEKIGTGSGIIQGALVDSFGSTVIDIADQKVDQIAEGLNSHIPCPPAE